MKWQVSRLFSLFAVVLNASFQVRIEQSLVNVPKYKRDVIQLINRERKGHGELNYELFATQYLGLSEGCLTPLGSFDLKTVTDVYYYIYLFSLDLKLNIASILNMFCNIF